MDSGYGNPYVVAQSEASVRVDFIRKTYMHLAGAILAFAAIEALLLQSGIGETIALAIFKLGGIGWLVILGLFMLVSKVADSWASSNTSRGMQYAGLGLFVFAEAILFLPLIYIATKQPQFAESNVIMNAALTTLLLTAGLTVFAMVTKSDFSFIRGFITIGGFVAMGVIVASIIFGFQLGMVFFGAMVLLAAGSILYTTSNVLRHYRPDQYVAASLALFSGVALMFYYILLMFMNRD